MDTTEQYGDLIATCRAIIDFANNRDHLQKQNRLSSKNINDIDSKLEVVAWVSNSIVETILLSELPISVLQSTHESLNLVHEQIIRLQAPSRFHSVDRLNNRENIVTDFNDYVDQVLIHIGPWLPVLALRSGEIVNWEQNIKSKLADIDKLGDEVKVEFESKIGEVETLLQTVKDAVSQVGAEQFTKNFENDANAAKKRARLWVGFAGFFGVLIILYLFFMFSESPETFTNVWESVYLLGSKAIVISVLFVAATFCSRIALANYNLESVNRHRATSLLTLRAFRESVEDDSASDTITVEAARAAFENIPTGFIAKQVSEPSGSSKTMEFIRQTYKKVDD